MHLAKNRISPYGVTFETSDGKSFDDIIEVTRDGIIFTFDGLSDYLQFFFPEDYGEDNTDGEWDARNYEQCMRVDGIGMMNFMIEMLKIGIKVMLQIDLEKII